MSTAAVAMNVKLISLTQIAPSPKNPRKHFDEERMADLVDSIRANGLLHPIVVRPAPEGLEDPASQEGLASKYEIIVGGRRYEAFHRMGEKRIPAVVRDVDERVTRCLRLVENVERDPLNPMEEAEAYAELLTDGLYPNAKTVAEDIGKSERYVFQRVQLARDLCDEAKNHLRAGTLTVSHADLLVRMADLDDQALMVTRAVSGAWSVRKLKAEIEKQAAPEPEPAAPDADEEPAEDAEDEVDLGDVDEDDDALPPDDDAKDQVRAEGRAAKRAQHEADEAEDGEAALSIEAHRVERAQRQAMLKACADRAGPFHLDDYKDLIRWMLPFCQTDELHAALHAVGWGDVVKDLDIDEVDDAVLKRVDEQEHTAALTQLLRCLCWARDLCDFNIGHERDEFLWGAAYRHGVPVDETRQSVL